MRQYQKGEVMLVMMAVMLAVVWLWSGHLDMMGHGSVRAEKPADTEQQTKAELPPAAKESPGPRH